MSARLRCADSFTASARVSDGDSGVTSCGGADSCGSGGSGGGGSDSVGMASLPGGRSSANATRLRDGDEELAQPVRSADGGRACGEAGAVDVAAGVSACTVALSVGRGTTARGDAIDRGLAGSTASVPRRASGGTGGGGGACGATGAAAATGAGALTGRKWESGGGGG